jgi:hypothetical protein
VIASVITIIVVTALGWLTTQAVVETARQQGAKELVALIKGEHLLSKISTEA